MKWLAPALMLIAAPLMADVTTPSGRVIDCYCTDSSGARVELGQEICLVVDGRAFIARCDMSLNVPIWRDTGAGCVSSAAISRPAPAKGQPQSR